MTTKLPRRQILLAGMAALAAPALIRPASAQQYSGAIEQESPRVRHNMMGFRAQRWQDHFQSISRHAILCDMDSRALHFWHSDGQTYRCFPTSVPMQDEFRRIGYTQIVLMRRDPVWIPTPSMRQRDPDLPARVDAGPENPMGTRAMNLGWEYYRIHGIDNVAKIGRRASNGCIGLYNHHVEEIFEWCSVGTPVRFIGSV